MERIAAVVVVVRVTRSETSGVVAVEYHLGSLGRAIIFVSLLRRE